MNDQTDPYVMPEKLGELSFGGTGRNMLVINSMETAWRLATLIVKAKMAPQGMDTTEAVTIAILHGAEVGMPPMMSVQRIAVIGGRPTIWGDAALSLVMNSGLLEEIDEHIEGEDDDRTAICTVKRRGFAPRTAKYSIRDAKTAGLWDDRALVWRKAKWETKQSGKIIKPGEWMEVPNDAPWRRNPDRMLTMRARGFGLRDNFADVLGGMYLREEFTGLTIEGELAPRQATIAETHAQTRAVNEPPEPPPPPIMNAPPEPPITKQYVDDNAGGPPEPPAASNEPPEPPAPPEPMAKMSAHEADIFVLRYKEQLEDVQTDAALDTLWNDMVLPVIDADRLDDAILAILQQADDERRGLIQTHGGDHDR